MPHVEEYEMGLPNGVGEQMLAHAIEKFDVNTIQICGRQVTLP